MPETLLEGVEETEIKEAGFKPLSEDEDMIREFITEAQEHLATIESGMLVLEQGAADAETLNAVFRGFHTIKGLAGFLEFTAIQSLTHEVETLLDLARKGQLAMSASVVDVVLEGTDIVRQELVAIEQRLAGRTPAPSLVNAALLERVRLAARGEEAPVKAAAPAAEKAAPETAKKEESASLRIDTAKLDQMMELVGEMVIGQTMLMHNPALGEAHLQGLARITAQVQRIAMSMRMVPIGAQFQKTARVVRDLSRRVGKQIAFATEGEETELDKTIAEALSDPLLHMIRNAIDHGIETPEQRVAAGKDPTATIRLSASNQAGQIVIAISDDGRGLNRERILQKARDNGLITAEQKLPDSEIFMLIFEAGFSTAEKVTDISGRGVGMDVVRRHVQALRGRIEITSEANRGTTFYIKLPLTLAILEGLVVAVGSERYIVPVSSVREILRPAASMVVDDTVLLRDAFLPVVRLHRRFHITPRTTAFHQGTLIVCESEGRRFALFVDEVTGKQEVVSKPLGSGLEHVPGVAGCAILGDGRIGLILDVDAIDEDSGNTSR